MGFFIKGAFALVCSFERTTVDENDIVTAVLNSSDAQDALRVIVRIAIREVALRANSAAPVEDVTIIGDMTIDRLRHTITIAGTVRPVNTTVRRTPRGVKPTALSPAATQR